VSVLVTSVGLIPVESGLHIKWPRLSVPLTVSTTVLHLTMMLSSRQLTITFGLSTNNGQVSIYFTCVPVM